MPHPLPNPARAKTARPAPRQSATLELCGRSTRRPGGRLFASLCDVADAFIARRHDPFANRVGVVLFYVAFHAARVGDEDDFRLFLRSALDQLVEFDPIERWRPEASDDPTLSGGVPPIPYPTFAGAAPDARGGLR